MGGMNGHEFLRATVTADLIHWGVIGLVALASWLLTRYIVRRQKAQTTPTVPLPPLPQQWIGPCPLCAHCCQIYGTTAPPTIAPSTIQNCGLCGITGRIAGNLRGTPMCMDCFIKLCGSGPSNTCVFCGNDARGAGTVVEGKNVPACVSCCNKRAAFPRCAVCQAPTSGEYLNSDHLCTWCAAAKPNKIGA
jgi:hypothetical protein